MVIVISKLKSPFDGLCAVSVEACVARISPNDLYWHHLYCNGTNLSSASFLLIFLRRGEEYGGWLAGVDSCSWPREGRRWLQLPVDSWPLTLNPPQDCLKLENRKQNQLENF